MRVTDCEIDSSGSSDESFLNPQKFGIDPETIFSPIFRRGITHLEKRIGSLLFDPFFFWGTKPCCDREVKHRL